MGTRTDRLLLSIEVTLLGILLALLQGGAVALFVGGIGLLIALTVFARIPGS